jgi:hypothetical protein
MLPRPPDSYVSFLPLISPQILDSDNSGGMSCTEFCNAIKKLVLTPTPISLGHPSHT